MTQSGNGVDKFLFKFDDTTIKKQNGMDKMLFQFDKNAHLKHNIDIEFDAEYQVRTDKLLFQFDKDASVNLKPNSEVRAVVPRSCPKPLRVLCSRTIMTH